MDVDIFFLLGMEVLIKIIYCGVCYLDVYLYDGYFNMGGGNKLDVIRGWVLLFMFGYEIEGMFEKFGFEVFKDGFKEGVKYVVFLWIGCGLCGVCECGDEYFCNVFWSFGVNVNGGFVIYVVVFYLWYFLNYDGIEDGLVVMYMCFGLIVFFVLKKFGDVLCDEIICIVGLGGVGMMGLKFVRVLFFDIKIIGVDIDVNKF